MIAQPASTVAGSEVEQELALLRAKVDDALQRINNLELRNRPALFPIDAPAMLFARQLCEKYFPGPVEVEIASAPEDPEAKWYVLLVEAKGTAKEVVDKDLQFFQELHAQFPVEAIDIRTVPRFE